MFVTNIRYGNRLVKKVYLGKKLVWKCIDMQGDAESTIYAHAYFNGIIINSIGGEADSFTQDEAKSNLLQLSLMKSDDERTKSYTDSTIKLFELLLLCADGESHSNNDAIMLNLDVILLNGISDSKSDETITGKVFDIDNISTNIKIISSTNATGSVSQYEQLNGNYAFALRDRATGWAINIMDVSADTSSDFTTSAVAGSWIPLKIIAFADSKTSGTSTLFTFDVLPFCSKISAHDTAEAICKLFDLLSISGEAESFSDGEGTLFSNKGIISSGYSENTTSGDSLISRYLLVLGNGNERITSKISGSIILWYPPIGDGIPLVANDGVDITQNGDILEIQQAYQIEIDEENGILEVI